MPATHFEFHVEELSMKAFLETRLEEFLPQDCTFEIFTYQGKPALLRKIGNRLRGYATWLPNNYRIVIIVGRDGDECEDLKSRLEQICKSAGLRSRRAASGPDWQVVTRIAIEELEAWYFGDWSAVRAAYPHVSPDIPRKAPYRNPDAIMGGTWEAFERLPRKQGYFKQGLAKVQAAAAIGKHLDPKNNGSHSFKVFRDAIADVATCTEAAT